MRKRSGAGAAGRDGELLGQFADALAGAAGGSGSVAGTWAPSCPVVGAAHPAPASSQDGAAGVLLVPLDEDISSYLLVGVRRNRWDAGAGRRPGGRRRHG
ncbi:hypothetical protein GCM10025792_36850 [Pseudonocardia tropica]